MTIEQFTSAIPELLLSLIMLAVFWGIKILIDYMKTKVTSTEYDEGLKKIQLMFKIVEYVVRYIEQNSKNLPGTMSSSEKKAMAMSISQQALKDKGIDTTFDEVDRLIEAAVNTVKQNSVK